MTAFPWREAPVADFAVIGDPVAHSLSPRMHQAAYRALGLNYRYVAIHVPVGEVALALDHLESLGYLGVNVTVPHKEEVLAACDDVEPFSKRVRAANSVRLSPIRACINTDALGFLATLGNLEQYKRVLVLGAGGSARAITAALAEAEYELRIFNRTRSKAEEMVRDLNLNAEILDSPDVTDADLIVNTTSASLQGDSIALDWDRMKPGALAYDLMYSRSDTPFVQAAKHAGVRTLDGLALLVAQGALSFEWWLGMAAPRDAMAAAIWKIVEPNPENIARAAAALLRGRLVGMPTETVYGIAAVATNRSAIQQVFEVKKRPAENPLIVHISNLDQIGSVAAEFPESARKLADTFWPGPLTIVLPKTERVPNEVTAGLSTVAVRMPSHPTARALIDAVGEPLAAPSANTFMSLSPTRAEHIEPDIADALNLILDGGPCEVGLESTVVDCSGGRVQILRPGGVSREQIEAVVGPIGSSTSHDHRSPGQYSRHYSPRTPLRLAHGVPAGAAGLTFIDPTNSKQVQMPADAIAYAAALYEALHQLDELGVEEIVVQQPPQSPEWEAVWDRLRKASDEGN